MVWHQLNWRWFTIEETRPNNVRYEYLESYLHRNHTWSSLALQMSWDFNTTVPSADAMLTTKLDMFTCNFIRISQLSVTYRWSVYVTETDQQDHTKSRDT